MNFMNPTKERRIFCKETKGVKKKDIMESPVSRGNDILLEFLEVAIHNILCVRHLYPSSIFVPVKKYGVPLQMSKFPPLNSYITSCLSSVQELLKKSEVDRLVVAFLNEESQPIEKFIFDILKLDAAFHMEDPYMIRTEQALRAFCLKLSSCDTYLKPLPKNSSFTLQIHTTEAALVNLADEPAHQNFPWIESEVHKTHMEDPKIVPIRTVTTDSFEVQTYIESITK